MADSSVLKNGPPRKPAREGIRNIVKIPTFSLIQLFNPCDTSSYHYFFSPIGLLIDVCLSCISSWVCFGRIFNSGGLALYLHLCYACCCRAKARIRHTTRRPRGLTKKSTAYRSHSGFAQRDELGGNWGNGYTPMYGDRVPRFLEEGRPWSSDT